MDSNQNFENGDISSQVNQQLSSKKKEAPDVTTAKFKVSQVKRQDAQRNAFTRWVNSKLKQDENSPFVEDLYKDLRDGNNLLSLLEVLTGRKTARVKGKLRLHKINNINVALNLLNEYKVKLVNIGNTDIVDGEPVPTLGLIWSMIYRFQIQGALVDLIPGDRSRSSLGGEKDAEKAILEWCNKAVEGYEGVDVKNFSTSWKDGLAFNALIHRYRPNLFHYESALAKSPSENLEHAFLAAETAFGVYRLLEPTDLEREPIDSRLVVMYVSTLYEKLKELDPKADDTVSMDEIEEFLSYIRTELDYLNGCEDFFASANDSSGVSDEELTNQYQDLINFIDNLQPHQIRVGELVNQIESLIDADLVPQEESDSLQNELDVLKNVWQRIFDTTTLRQERLRELLLNIVDKPLKSVDSLLHRYRDELNEFSQNPDELSAAFEQYWRLLAFIDELRKVESEIEDIRTGNVGGDALAVLSDEDEQIVANNLKELINSFMELGQDVAEVKHRINEHLYEQLSKKMAESEEVVSSAQEITEKEDANNNPSDESLNERLAIHQDLLARLDHQKPDIDAVTGICQQLDENFDIDAISLDEVKQNAVTLDENYSEQLRRVKDFLEHSFNEDPEQEDMKRFKKSVGKKFRKSGGSDSRNSSISRTESEVSAESARIDFEDAASHPVDKLAAKHTEESKRNKILEDWANKFGTTWSFVEIAEERLSLIQDLKSWQPTLREKGDLEEEFSRWEDTIYTTIKFGNNLYQEDDVHPDVKAIILKDVLSLQEKWTSLREMKDQALVSRALQQLDSLGKLESWKNEFETTMVWINEKQKELERMDDLESSLHMLEDAATKIESLYSEIKNYQGQIESVVEVGTKFCRDDEVDNSSSPSIHSDIRSLETTWDLLREKCTAVQLSIKEKMLIKQSQEREYMAEWHETHIKIDDWLSSAESEAALFDKAHEYIIDVEVQVAEHEELVFRLATEEKTINDLLEVGENLTVEKIRQTDNRMKVKNELKGLKKRKMKLNARLVGQQESLTSFLDHLVRIETAEFEVWLEKCRTVENVLLAMENVEKSENVDSVDGAKNSIATEEVFIGAVEAVQPDIDRVADDGQTMISDGKMGKLKRQSIRIATKALQDLYEKKRFEATTRLREMNEELLNYQHQQHEKIGSWINKAEMFYRWIESEFKEVEVLFSNPDDDYTIEKIIDEEQAVKEVKSNVDSRSSIFDALVKEGETLKCNNSIERDHPEEHENILNLMDSTDSKWNHLNSIISEKLQGVTKMLSAQQAQLLSVCLEQIKDLENIIAGLGPVSDGFDTLSKDADYLSDMFMMIGQIKANVLKFDKYAKDFQNSADVSNANKFEIRESNEMLQTRMNAVEASADERKSLVHDKIIDVLTESMVALSDTVSNLEEKCDDIVVPDNLDTVDLVERYMTLEDIHRRLIACEVSLKDIESLGGVAESCMVLESGEGDDITREIAQRKAFINHVQQMAREKKSRIYGLLVYTFKRRIEEFEKMLTNIEEDVQQDSESMMDLKHMVEKIHSNHASLEKLDDVQKNTDEISLQINEMVEGEVLVSSDEEEIKQKSEKLNEHLADALASLKLQSNSLKHGLTAAVNDKLDELQEWLSMMERRREGDDQVGPDSMTIKKQITEMSVVEGQLKDKRLTPHLHYADEIATTYLDSTTLENMKEADHDWVHLSDWIVHRTKVLHAAQEAWELFRQEEVELLDYLRDKEKQIKNFEPINLEEEELIANRLAQLKGLLTGMEEHKDDVNSLHKVSDEVIELIGQSSPMSNNIKSQVADIHDCWNNTVRQIIESISKLNGAKEMLQNMEQGITEVRTWLDDAKSILRNYTGDVPDDVMEDLKPQVQEKCDEKPTKFNTLSKVNSLSRELLDDIDGPSYDVIDTNLKNLNKDWENVTDDLEKKKNMKKRPCCWWCYRRWFLRYGYYN